MLSVLRIVAAFLFALSVLSQGHPAVLFCFVWLYVSAAGPGPWSLDALYDRRRGRGVAG